MPRRQILTVVISIVISSCAPPGGGNARQTTTTENAEAMQAYRAREAAARERRIQRLEQQTAERLRREQPSSQPQPSRQVSRPVTRPVDSRVEAGSEFQREITRLIQHENLDEFVLRAVVYFNDAEIFVNEDMTTVLGRASCDEQRAFVAGLYTLWAGMDTGPGAGITIKSYTGRVLASADPTVFSGLEYHCD